MEDNDWDLDMAIEQALAAIAGADGGGGGGGGAMVRPLLTACPPHNGGNPEASASEVTRESGGRADGRGDGARV